MTTSNSMSVKPTACCAAFMEIILYGHYSLPTL